MIHAHTIPADRHLCDYREPRYTYTSDVREMPRRCECGQFEEHVCAATGDPLCDEHAVECDCNACFAEGLKYRASETVLVEDLRLFRKHAAVPASEGEEG